MKRRPLRLGLIGAGAWGRNYVRTVPEIKGLSLARVARSKDDWRKVAGARDLDGVIIAAPTPLHVEMASYAVEHGLPVLVEKPLTIELVEAEALLGLAQERRVPVLVEYTYLFHPAFQALKERAKRMDRIRAIRSFGGNRGPFRKDTPPLWDYGTHDVAMCLDLLGEEPRSSRADRQEAPKRSKGENLTLRLLFGSGLEAELNVGNGMKERQRRFEVYGERQALVFDDLEPKKLSLHDLDREGRLRAGKPLEAEEELPLTRAVKAFAGAILSDSRDLSSLELARSVTAVLTACQESLANPAR